MKITLLQQNDSHGVLWEHDEMFWETGRPVLKKTGGLARILQYVKDVKAENDRVLFFDGGDTFHGTLPVVESKGQAALDVIQKMPIDAIVPGNWDYAYGKERLSEMAAQLPGAMLACNCTVRNTGEPYFKEYLIRELDGMKVGIIGLTYPHEDKTMPSSFSEGLAFTTGVEEVRRLVGELSGNTDLIIVLSHMGLPLDAKLAGLVDGIDVILSGHSHDRVQVPDVINGTYIVQAGFSASFVGRLDLRVEEGEIRDARYELVHNDDSFGEDPEIRSLVEKVLGAYEKERCEVVGETSVVLHRMALEETPMDKLITDSYLASLGVDAAFSNGWRYGPPIAPGPLTLFDLHTIIPPNPELFKVCMTGRELTDALEKNLQFVFASDPFNQQGGYILRSSGISMTYKPYNPDGGRIQTLQVGGKDIDPDKTYTVAGGDGQTFGSLSERKQMTGIHAVDAIREFLRTNSPFPGITEKQIISA
ncbi:bifunctional UDP-sugar hydrolase/5'-nucleotidase [Bhargavaea ullalensis]|uniref:2',3'-cyclic-nucleotide 2'-phosphodiesterase (5'-nucleotidase family) n=1 Tax=Bhargavaea ullalensis TaxID=1265685 RepID=A0ABV2GDP6_9BACL